MHFAPEICEATSKPNIILLSCNSTKGDVDAMSNQMAHVYTVKEKLDRWSLFMFYNIIDLRTIAERVI